MAAALSAEEQRAVRETIYELTDFWAGLPMRELPKSGYAINALVDLVGEPPYVFHARRLQTRGRPVLLQTLEWLIRQGYENPVVWIEED